MKVIKPVVIAGALLVSSTATETYAAYNAGTAYALNARATYAGRIWECIQGPSTGNQPDTSPVYWTNFGPTNVQAMFDTEISTATTAEETLSVVVMPGLVNSLALLEIDAVGLAVTVQDGLGGPVVYEYAQSLDGSEVLDWLQYFYQPFLPVREVVLTNLPLYGSAHITVTLTSAGTINVGTLAVGASTELGGVEYGASAGIRDYSRKDTSATGVTTFTRRKYSKWTSARLMVDNFALNNLQRVLADLRATPCVWVGVDDPSYAPLTVFGFYRDFSLDVAYPKKSYCSIEIEGLA